jgi:hypothetical protein
LHNQKILNNYRMISDAAFWHGCCPLGHEVRKALHFPNGRYTP